MTLFRFALREDDLALAGLIAGAAGSDPALRSDLSAELARAAPERRGPLTLPVLQLVGLVLRALARLDRERGRS